jgi:hypothetical protein
MKEVVIARRFMVFDIVPLELWRGVYFTEKDWYLYKLEIIIYRNYKAK